MGEGIEVVWRAVSLGAVDSLGSTESCLTSFLEENWLAMKEVLFPHAYVAMCT